MEFTTQLRQAASDLWQKSMQEPFIKELKNGKLPLDIFRFYLLQDRYYLAEFSKLHQLIADRTDRHEVKTFLQSSVRDLNDSEIGLREHFFQELQISAAEVKQTIIAPTCYAYVNHLYSTLAKYGVAPAISAITPCYWLYQEIGQKMAQTGSPVAIYQKWIDTYDSTWYENNVAKILTLINQLAANASKDEQEQMKTAFVRSSFYEQQFWQMAYRQEKWQ